MEAIAVVRMISTKLVLLSSFGNSLVPSLRRFNRCSNRFFSSGSLLQFKLFCCFFRN
jgi:hypothetical protein